MRISLCPRRSPLRIVRPLLQRDRGERGAIALIAAIAIPMVFAATALSFDIGRVVDTNRYEQAVADAVALDAANFFDGQPADTPDPYVFINGSNTNFLDQVVQYEGTLSAMRNGLNLSSPRVSSDAIVIGACSPGSSNPCATFNPIETCPLTTALPAPGSLGSCAPVSGADPATIVNAAKMSSAGVTSFVFQVGSATSNRSATAMRVTGQLPACTSNCGGTTTTSTTTSTTLPPPPPPPNLVGVSAFDLGSGLLDENTNNASSSDPMLQQVLTQELQPNAGANLAALSFSGLSAASVSLGDILAANSSAGTLSNLLEAEITPGTALSYYYNALLAQSGPISASAATQLSTDLGVTPSGTSGIQATGGLKLCQLVSLPGGTDGCSASGTQLAPVAYAQFNALDYLLGVASLINLQHAISLNVAGLGVTATINAVSPLAQAGPGPAAVPSCPANMAPCPVTATDTQAQVALNIPNVGNTGVGLNLQVIGAQATATLDGLNCGSSPDTESVTIDGSSGAATITPTFTVGSASTQGSQISVGGNSFTASFSGPFGQSTPAPQTVGTQNPNIVIDTPASLTLLAAPVTTALGSFDTMLAPLLQALGVNIGYAMVADNYVNCAITMLVSPGS